MIFGQVPSEKKRREKVDGMAERSQTACYHENFLFSLKVLVSRKIGQVKFLELYMDDFGVYQDLC